MPAIGFTCTDENTCLFADCFAQCRIADQHPAGRCMALRNLRMIAEQREWQGKPSVTQLQKGTREAYLGITTDFYIDPQGAIFRIIGTKAHGLLDKHTGDNELGEIRLEIEGITGAFDYMDENGNLFDTKTAGSYKCMAWLGITTINVPTGEFFKSGPRKGLEKTRKETIQGEPDLHEQALQLNMYRLMLEDSGFPIKKMFLDIAVRDGGIQAAVSRGVTKNAYLIEVPYLPDDDVLAYFLPKRDALLWHLQTETLPAECSGDKTWDGRKCLQYCDTRDSCPHGIELKAEGAKA